METKIDADDVTVRRYSETDVFDDSDGHFTVTGRTKSGAKATIRARLEDLDDAFERYAKARLESLVQEHAKTFHEELTEQVEEHTSAIESQIQGFLAGMEEDFDFKDPARQQAAEAATESQAEAEAEEKAKEGADTAQVEDEGGVKSNPSSPL